MKQAKDKSATNSVGQRGIVLTSTVAKVILGITLILFLSLVITKNKLLSKDSASHEDSTSYEGMVCGNGDIEEGEQCDDGNLIDGDGCTASCLIEESCYDPGNTFSFFTWSDSYGGAGEGGVRRLFNDVTNQATYPKRIIPRMWFAAGDIPYVPDSGITLESLNEEISGDNYPFVCSPSNQNFPMFVGLGNHDLDGADADEIAAKIDYWSNNIGSQVENTLVGIQNVQFGPDNGYDARTTYSFDYKNTHFVVYNQYYGDPNYPTSSPTGCVRQTMYDWINQDLANTSKAIKMVIGHEPAWSYCSGDDVPGNNVCINYGNEFTEDLLVPGLRPRPHSTSGEAWLEGFGRHWGDSLEEQACPLVNGQESRAVFWAMLADHEVVAHFVGHNHTYSSRLVDADGPRNEPELSQAERNRLAYGKTGDVFSTVDGVWEIDSGHVHSSAGSAYVLVTVRDNRVTFEAWDQIGGDDGEPFGMIERWHLDVDDVPPPGDTIPPTVSLTNPPDQATLSGTINVSANSSDNVAVAGVQFLLDGANFGAEDNTEPYAIELDTTTLTNGGHTLGAVAGDAAGNIATATTLSVTVNNVTPPPATATYEGFGAITRGAEDCPDAGGHESYHVTSLADSGAGTLRDGLSQGCRHIIFDVAGTITLQSNLFIQHSYLTIDGLSAPSPGITIEQPTNVGTAILADGNIGAVHDVIIHHLRMDGQSGGLNIGSSDIWGLDGEEAPVYNIILDHITAIEAADGVFDIWKDVHDVTISWNVIERTAYGLHLTDPDLETTRQNISIHHNLFAHNNERQINLDQGNHEMIDFVNNVVYGWGWMEDGASGFKFTNLPGTTSSINVESNIYHYVPGPHNIDGDQFSGHPHEDQSLLFDNGGHSAFEKEGGEAYFDGNIFPSGEMDVLSTSEQLVIPAQALVTQFAATTLGDRVVPCAGTHYPTESELALMNEVQLAVGGSRADCPVSEIYNLFLPIVSH